MTDYKTIAGKKIKFLTSDLSMSTATEGELFYSDTDSKFKVGVLVKAWASGGNLNTGRKNFAGCGPQTAGLVFGGNTGAPIKDETESYDGSSWTEVGDINNARYGVGGHGTQTAALCSGGSPGGNQSPPGHSEEFDGSSWTEGDNLSNHRMSASGCGTQTAGLIAGGYQNPPSGNTDYVETYDGSSWTETTDLPSPARSVAMLVGTQTAALCVAGGGDPSYLTDVQSWDGSSWTEVAAVSIPRGEGAYWGLQTDCIVASGYGGTDSSHTARVEQYDGTSWTEIADCSTTRVGQASCGGPTSSSGLMAGGATPTVSAATEEYSSSVTLKTVTDS
jgi:hypothetical protein